jgi:hypothetical protein
MNDEQADRIVRLLEEIRDGQRLQLERQAQALQRQEELLAQQRERLAGLSQRSGQAERLLDRSAKVVASARILAFVALPIAVLMLAFVIWVLLARLAA